MDIIKVRKALGLTQQGLADTLQVTVATVNRWENGKANPHKSFLNQLKKMSRNICHRCGYKTAPSVKFFGGLCPECHEEDLS